MAIEMYTTEEQWEEFKDRYGADGVDPKPPTESAWDEYVKIMFAYAFQMDSREAIAIPGGEEYKKRIIDGKDKALREWFRKYESEIKNIPIKEK